MSDEMTKTTLIKKEIKHVLLIIASSILGALGMHVFVYPSNFAPIGVDGITVMLQVLTDVNAGIYLLMINIPLFLFAWFVLKKRYVLYTICCILVTSGTLLLLEQISFYQYITESDKLISAIFSA